jgi:myo-inositol-1(or 4)-monophosphatase
VVEKLLSVSEIDVLLSHAEKAARQAGLFLSEHVGQTTIQKAKSSHDDLLDVDLTAEHLILEVLQKESPFLGILSEEAGRQGNMEQYWIIDPLDGSANFQRGNPLFAIALAIRDGQSTVGSLIFLPQSGEVFRAIKGQGAFLDGVQLHVSRVSRLDNAVVHAGDIMKEGDLRVTTERLNDVAKIMTRARRVRMIGSAAIDFAYLASGRADVLLNHAQAPWDRDAGRLLLQEAGGTALEVEREQGQKLYLYENGKLQQELQMLFSLNIHPVS